MMNGSTTRFELRHQNQIQQTTASVNPIAKTCERRAHALHIPRRVTVNPSGTFASADNPIDRFAIAPDLHSAGAQKLSIVRRIS